MDDRTLILAIEAFCQETNRPAVLNALHACIPGHPFGRNNPTKWRNAWTIVCQHPTDFSCCDTSWLAKQAMLEAVANPF